MGKKVKIYQTESYITYVVREPIIIDLDEYPELEDMSNEEIVSYLESSSYDMKSQDVDSYDSLSDELSDKDVIKDKIYGDESSYVVEDIEE